MKTRNIMLITLIMAAASFSGGCKKLLDEKSSKNLVVPSTLADLQAILDNLNTMTIGYASAGELSTDDYYLTDADYNALSVEQERRIYTWEPDNLFLTGTNGSDWNAAARAIYAANSVLVNVPNVPDGPQAASIRGQALLWRGERFLDLAQVWCLPYDAGTAANDLGLPLRLNDDFNEPSVRSTLAETYNQILSDLRSAANLLPTSNINAVRPTRQAAYGVLARCYLNMRRYDEAGRYADSCLKIYNTLLDYNALKATDTYPLKELNAEVIHYNAATSPAQLATARAKMSLALYNLYAANDLRKTLFFRTNADGSYTFKGSYTSGPGRQNGVTTDEMLLIRAECAARAGAVSDAMKDLNTLLEKRYRTGTLVPLTATSQASALAAILLERRKELVFRGLRWMDIRRLNKEGAGITLTRTVNGKTYTLPPNDLKYALPLPEDVISLSGMPQNPR